MLVTRGFDLERVAAYGYAGVFVATFLSSTTIIFPAPGVVVVVVAAACLNPALVALLAAVGGSLGEFTGYLAGYWGKIAIGDTYGGRYLKIENWMQRHVRAKGLRTEPEIARILKKYIYPALQDRDFESIRRSEVTALLDRVEDESGPRQADTVLTVLRSGCFSMREICDCGTRSLAASCF